MLERNKVHTISHLPGIRHYIKFMITDDGVKLIENTTYEPGLSTKHRGILKGVEGMVLAHAYEGIDVTKADYANGIRIVVTSIVDECIGRRRS